MFPVTYLFPNIMRLRSRHGFPSFVGKIYEATMSKPSCPTKSGDWRCTCGENNFAHRTECFKCHKNKPLIVKPGDWLCSCGEVNFASRSECRKCLNPKSLSSSSVSIPIVSPIESTALNLNNLTLQRAPGSRDWTCSCGEVNFSYRTECRKCTKSTESNPTTINLNNLTLPRAPGSKDWTCSCGEVNFSHRIACRKCIKSKEPKESDNTRAVPATVQEDVLLCKICFDAQIQARLKCGHMATCTACAFQMKMCPICRATYDPDTDIQTTYIS